MEHIIPYSFPFLEAALACLLSSSSTRDGFLGTGSAYHRQGCCWRDFCTELRRVRQRDVERGELGDRGVNWIGRSRGIIVRNENIACELMLVVWG